MPPYSTEQGGFVACVAIARYATVTLSIPEDRADADAATRAPLERIPLAEVRLARAAMHRAGLSAASKPPLRLTITSDFPVGAGLGGSSAAGVAAIGAIARYVGEPLDRAALAERSRAMEVEDLRIAGGRQDHYAAAFGGALALCFDAATTVEQIPLAPALASRIERRCIILYTGESRISATQITSVLDSYRRRDTSVMRALAAMRELAKEMASALRESDLDSLGALVGVHWNHQRALHHSISTPRIDALMRRAQDRGALGGKALGASGGGCVLIITPEDEDPRLRPALAELATLLPFAIDRDGFSILGNG
ncbi:MAG: hypothetical protein ACRENI_00995 [Gemmatimonadaceae bacterium]